MATKHWAASALDFPFDLVGSAGTVASVDAERCWPAESARSSKIVLKRTHSENPAEMGYRGAAEKGAEA